LQPVCCCGYSVATAVLLQHAHALAQFYASGLAGVEKDAAKAEALYAAAAADWAHPSATFELAALHLVRRRASTVDANP
jgi:TPR repeat protein